MKNAFVLSHHHGDDGTVDIGMILTDVTEQRFSALEKQGLVREATAAEVKAGYQPPFTEGGELTADEAEGEKKAKEPANKKAKEPANKKAGDAADKAD